MASRIEFVEFIVDQLRGAGEITYRKMFGEYGIYCNGKIFGLICDDQLFLKITKAGQETCPDLVEAPPYEGAKKLFSRGRCGGRRHVDETCKSNLSRASGAKAQGA